MQNKNKFKLDKVAPSIIGGIIQQIEEQPIPNTNWIETIKITNDNIWTITIKPKTPYYPQSILLYNKITKSRILKGKLFEIEETLFNIYNQYK